MIVAKSPTRVDLAGGTLDCWPLHLFVGDCQTVNLAIDIYTGCDLKVRGDQTITVHIEDLNYNRNFSDLNKFLSCEDSELNLLGKIVDFFRPTFGFEIRTYSQSPVGGGLGGSSSLCVSLIKAFQELTKTSMSVHARVELAHNLEAKVIRSPTGTQDYYPALLGGLNILHYRSSGIEIEPLAVSLNVLRDHLMLVYTGKSHHSGINNWQVIKGIIDGDPVPLSALKHIAQISADMAQACRDEDWSAVPKLFRSEFDYRVKLASSFCSPEIDRLQKLVVAHGADAVKICGAGGGGCVLVWAAPDRHERIRAECQKNGFQPLKAVPVPHLKG